MPFDGEALRTDRLGERERDVVVGQGDDPVLRVRRVDLELLAGAWQTVARSQDLPEGAVTGFDTGTVTGFVGRAAGRVFAISGVCTHLGCKLALDGPARELRCPCHSAAFTLTGTVLHHPRVGALPPLPRIPVRESGGAVQVFAAVAPR
jgi:nitrite reductase/ring-hydroxylating ferredoxin subunit